MKLSFKFFCIAYITVLLSTGIGGIFLIKSATDALWNSQTQRVNSSANYAADSFKSFAEISLEEIEPSEIADIERQIGYIMDSCIYSLDIYTADEAANDWLSLDKNCGFNSLFRKNSSYMMESVCRLDTDIGTYFLRLCSDFTEIENRCDLLWRGYIFVVLSIAVVSGILLYVFARKVAKPINILAVAADRISSGNYGETVALKSRDREIRHLAENFNLMSRMVDKTIKEIKSESEKRDMFVADFTHEIKTPMTAIIGYAEMLNSYDLSSSEIKQASKAIYKEGKRLEKLSLQLLELYVYRNDDVPLDEISLSDITKQLETTLIFLSRKYKVGFSVDFHGERVMANSVLLFSLLYNLADNGFKASEPESEIKITSRIDGEFAVITVIDHGKGIAPENIKLLTEPFFREDKARSRAQGGAGLGLALCKEIAAIHGTELSFESRSDIGTRVSFKLRLGEKKHE